MTLEELNKRFGIAGSVSFEAGPGGLTQVAIRAKGGEARVMLHGAHVTHWQPAGEKPVIWMSGKSWFEDGKPIRGGVPICLPWFGAATHAADMPGHGIARLRAWEFISARTLPDGRVEAVLATRSDEWTQRYWPHEFVAKFTVVVGATLTMSLNMTNIDKAPYAITEALHTYFAVSDIHQVKVHGLENLDFTDTVGGGRRVVRQGGEPITFAAETDRNNTATQATTVLEDPGMGRKITIEKTGSDSTVVWNPWIAKSAKMVDFGDDEWPGMVCIETANLGPDAVTIKPGKSHTMEARISIHSQRLLG